MWELYDAMLAALPRGGIITVAGAGALWTSAETDAGGFGLAMTTEFSFRPPMYEGGILGLGPAEAGGAVKSWNLSEAGFGMAAINAYYNAPERVTALGCYEPYGHYCTRGLDFAGKTVGVIGHLRMPDGALAGAKQVYILERHPTPGDYPDSACDFLLPKCDVVLMTASTLVNKTLPHLLELCRKAFVILTGPTAPLCPALLDFGIDRIAGLAVTDKAGAREHVLESRPGPPYGYGATFLLER